MIKIENLAADAFSAVGVHSPETGAVLIVAPQKNEFVAAGGPAAAALATRPETVAYTTRLYSALAYLAESRWDYTWACVPLLGPRINCFTPKYFRTLSLPISIIPS